MHLSPPFLLPSSFTFLLKLFFSTLLLRHHHHHHHYHHHHLLLSSIFFAPRSQHRPSPPHRNDKQQRSQLHANTHLACARSLLARARTEAGRVGLNGEATSKNSRTVRW
ncbi:hypothetical protein E2C01_084631 [Portunus trituberculatus]|uniref:Uncharacterized protein n=1 Tax=Portunus trituberculatus TaxID=210409 RepID=A0A5B7J894_PORTR|nr:hypothetical protein [Portunus trituberculatus]